MQGPACFICACLHSVTQIPSLTHVSPLAEAAMTYSLALWLTHCHMTIACVTACLRLGVAGRFCNFPLQ